MQKKISHIIAKSKIVSYLGNTSFYWKYSFLENTSLTFLAFTNQNRLVCSEFIDFLPSQTAVVFDIPALKGQCSWQVSILQTPTKFESGLYSRGVFSFFFSALSHPYSFIITVKTNPKVRFPRSIFFKSSRWPKLNREGQ